MLLTLETELECNAFVYSSYRAHIMALLC